MKRIIILKHGGGELANQLWNYVSIYSYGLELGLPVVNPSFFEYHSFFRLISDESILTKIRAQFFKKLRRRSHIINRLARAKYAVQVKLICSLNSRCVMSSENSDGNLVYLPPTAPIDNKFDACGNVYFTGWLFRNPAGLIKFRDTLLKKFLPVDIVIKKVDEIILPNREKYEKIIGIHIRQADYKIFKNGRYLIDQKRVREIISEYASLRALDANKTLFVIASDGPVDISLFKGLNTYISSENAIIDLFLLSRTDVILGSDSSFGAFASWYSNIPHIIFKNETIDWEYYKDKKVFFENKYSNMVQF